MCVFSPKLCKMFFLAFEEGGIDVGGSMLKKEWCFEGVHAPLTPKKLENLFL